MVLFATTAPPPPQHTRTPVSRFCRAHACEGEQTRRVCVCVQKPSYTLIYNDLNAAWFGGWIQIC